MAALFYARLFCEHPFNVGASLLAKASGQSTSSLNDPPHSRASSLPQDVYEIRNCRCRSSPRCAAPPAGFDTGWSPTRNTRDR
ncbi:hypothetical protein FGA82_09975 [Pseudomonas fluorescens]|nr:hypothetical protein FGA82_09975 [Pseudomonas fluorescens]